jgi:cation diffusion facilitator family transporter
MASHDVSAWRHSHSFDPGNRAAERRTWIVVAITAATMVAEIAAGVMTGSMALIADGWHMATHVVALSIAGVAYLLARRWSSDERFAFGTWKIEVLGSYSSALLLGVVAVAMVIESVRRIFQPESIQYMPALIVAVVGLVVNLVCALVLQGRGHGHAHHVAHGPGAHAHHDDDHHHHHHHHRDEHPDLNLRSAYAHVLTDAFTSVLAIAALAAGLWAGWGWMDPVMGIVGAVVIAWWAKGLLADAARVLLDREMDSPIVQRLRRAIESDSDAQIADLHVWRVGRGSYASVVTIIAREPRSPDVYRARLDGIPELAHVSIEVNQCPHDRC